MGLFFYNIFLFFFRIGIHIAALFNTKAAKWVKGRRGIWEKLQAQINAGQQPPTSDLPFAKKVIWVHCASLGEFEQGRPLCEKIRQRFPGCRLLLTFFSPSGYEIRKNYEGADWVFYLPMDSAGNARRMLDIVNPALVIFIKYEFWYYYLRQINQRKIPLFLVSALFRDNSIFFKWYGGLQRKMLYYFDQLFLQDERSRELLAQIGVQHTTVSGDTRFDRVLEIADRFEPIAQIGAFVKGQPVLIAGSTWPADEEVLKKAWTTAGDHRLKLIIAPHEINAEHIASLKKLFPAAILWSQVAGKSSEDVTEDAPVLIIDNIGMLSRLYKYATITYIGGGFGKGIHNTLEAAVYGKPVLFGPAYQKFREAVQLVELGGAMPVSDAAECLAIVQKLLSDEQAYQSSCNIAGKYVRENGGATEKVVGYIQEKRLLTS